MKGRWLRNAGTFNNVYMAHWSFLDLPQPLRIKNCVYVHNSRFVPHKFSHHPLTLSSSCISSSFFCCERKRCEEWVLWGWVVNEWERESKKWENAATRRNIQNNVYFNVLCFTAYVSSLFLPFSSLTYSLTSMTKEWDVHKGQIGDTFFPSDRRNVSIWQGRVMCCLAWKLSSSSTDSSKERRFVPMPSIHSQHSFSAFFTTEKYTFSYMKVKGFKRSKCNFFSHFF